MCCWRDADALGGYVTPIFPRHLHINLIASGLHYILIVLSVDSVSYKINYKFKCQFDTSKSFLSIVWRSEDSNATCHRALGSSQYFP